jgi:hypothetical protein
MLSVSRKSTQSPAVVNISVNPWNKEEHPWLKSYVMWRDSAENEIDAEVTVSENERKFCK